MSANGVKTFWVFKRLERVSLTLGGIPIRPVVAGEVAIASVHRVRELLGEITTPCETHGGAGNVSPACLPNLLELGTV